MRPWTAFAATYPLENEMPEQELPDIYCDQVSVAQSPFGIAITFALSASTPPAVPAQGDPKAVVRMSLEHAKIMIMMLRKQLKQYELEHLGEQIRIPATALQQMKLSEEDW